MINNKGETAAQKINSSVSLQAFLKRSMTTTAAGVGISGAACAGIPFFFFYSFPFYFFFTIIIAFLLFFFFLLLLLLLFVNCYCGIVFMQIPAVLAHPYISMGIGK